jgi:N-acetylglucosamine malate deacetylase 1
MNILVVAAHPDDEILGCGGAIARHVYAGNQVNILIVAEGATSRDDETSENVKSLQQVALAAANVLGAQPPRFLEFPDNRLDSIDLLTIIKHIESYIEEIQPEAIYTHHGGDLNIDHRLVHEAVITACRPLPGSCVKRIFSFESPSSTEWATTAIGPTFAPVHFIDISTVLDKKMDALRCYKIEMRAFPHVRSIEAMEAVAKVRGAQVGMTAAEAFQVELDLSF